MNSQLQSIVMQIREKGVGGLDKDWQFLLVFECQEFDIRCLCLLEDNKQGRVQIFESFPDISVEYGKRCRN